MSFDISYDPVSVIDENEAVGSIADIFLDIRQTMKNTSCYVNMERISRY
ncbi:MAG: hypothetical protein ACJ0BR_07155 [Candidatus Puniceispirillales bacterium]